jgi:hypothetical protein
LVGDSRFLRRLLDNWPMTFGKERMIHFQANDTFWILESKIPLHIKNPPKIPFF